MTQIIKPLLETSLCSILVWEPSDSFQMKKYQTQRKNKIISQVHATVYIVVEVRTGAIRN